MSVPEGNAPSFADAAAATRNLINEANAEPAAAPQENYPVTEPAQVDPGTPAVEQTPDTPTPLSWDQIDLSVLPEDARKVVQEGYLRQSDYTRKTQELAEQRKQFEQYGDPETVQAAVEFARSLEDPANLRQLKAEIEEYLGNTPDASLQAPATEHVDTTGLDPATKQRIEAMEARFAEMEHQAQEAELVEQLQSKFQQQEDAIRADYPQYTQQDIDKIYERSETTGWDLFAARDRYEADREYFTKMILGNKEGFPQQANGVRSDTLVDSTPDMNTLESAREASKRLFAAE